LPLDQVTPELYRALSLLEPFGMDNPEPVFTARGVRVITPPQIVKDKHVRLRVAAGLCPAQPESSSSSWRSNVSFKAMGWGLKESSDQLQLLAGDRIDIAYTLGMNDHPEFGGLELTLKDMMRSA